MVKVCLVIVLLVISGCDAVTELQAKRLSHQMTEVDKIMEGVCEEGRYVIVSREFEMSLMCKIKSDNNNNKDDDYEETEPFDTGARSTR